MSDQIMVISVMAKDRPGIVAEVTECISALDGNLADLRQSVLRGYFTMILIAGFPATVSREEVKHKLTDATSANVSVISHEENLATADHEEQSYVLSAVGQDRVGLVAQITRFCSDHGINILDLASHVDGSIYTMMLLLDLANIKSLDVFKQKLTGFGKANGIILELQHSDIFRATNEI